MVHPSCAVFDALCVFQWCNALCVPLDDIRMGERRMMLKPNKQKKELLKTTLFLFVRWSGLFVRSGGLLLLVLFGVRMRYNRFWLFWCMFIGFVCSCACGAFWRVYWLYAVVGCRCAVSRFKCSRSSYTADSAKTIVSAFSCAYGHDKRIKKST